MALPIVEPTEAAYTSVKGAATLLGCHTDTVRNLMYRGELSYVRLGRAIRIPLSELTPEALAANASDAR